MNSFSATYSRRQFRAVANYRNLESAKYWNPLKSWSQCEYSIDCCKSSWNQWWRHYNRNLALWSICDRPKNWPRWIHRNYYHSKTSFEQYLCDVSFHKKYGRKWITLYWYVFSRPKECRIHSGDNELFPLHSFDNGLCLDDRLGVELLEISQSIRFKYRTFRFQNLKTINQRSRIIRPSSNYSSHMTHVTWVI